MDVNLPMNESGESTQPQSQVDINEYGEPIPKEADIPPADSSEDATAATEAQPQQQTEPVVSAPAKRVQTPEENAYFAEMRRRQQAMKYLKDTPEYKLSHLLSQQYGMSVEDLHKKVEEAVLQRQAQQSGVPVEVLKRIEEEKKARQELERRLAETEFKSWYQERMAEAAAVKQQFPMLTDEDIQAALSYMLTELKSTRIPLAQAVFALHGDKIVNELRKSAQQEALAQVSGRKPGPLPSQSGGGKSSPAAMLTEEERYFARLYGMSDEEYVKWRDMQEG